MVSVSWISIELFQKALKDYTANQNLKVISFSDNTLTSTGESFCSDLFRTTIIYKTQENEDLKNIKVIVKRAPEKGQALRFTEELNYFKKEIKMFQVTLLEFHKILGSLGAVSAKSLYAQEEPFPLLIIEDLSPMGFQMSNQRREGLDLEHCMCVVEKLSQFHATSLVLQNQNPKAFRDYTESMFWGRPIVREWINLATDEIINVCSKFLDFKKLSNKLKGIKDKIPERAANAAKPNGFNVLNHGDPWTSNFLFLYKDGKVTDMRLVDYQVVVYSSPAIDLHYFLATSPTAEVHNQHLDALLNHYYNSLLSNLKQLNYQPIGLPSLEEFKSDWFSRIYYGVVSAFTVMPLIKCEARKDASFDYLLAPHLYNEESFRHHVYNNPVSLKHIRYMLSFFNNLGVFDS